MAAAVLVVAAAAVVAVAAVVDQVAAQHSERMAAVAVSQGIAEVVEIVAVQLQTVVAEGGVMTGGCRTHFVELVAMLMPYLEKKSFFK